MAKPPKSVRDRVIDAALRLAAEETWSHITLGDIAMDAGISLEALCGEFDSKTSIVVAIMERTNATMLGGIDASTESEPVHDRLLDSILQRLDSLQPHKSAICSILRDLPSDPASLVCLAPGFFRAMAWTLEAAGIGSAGLGGRLRVKGLGAIY